MKYLKILGLAAVASMTLTAFLGTSSASASNLRIFGSGTNLGVGTHIEGSIEASTSAILEDSAGLVASTCTGSALTGSLSRVTPTGQPKGSLSTLTFAGCPAVHAVKVLAKGEFEIRNIAGTTNGTVLSYGAKVSVFNTILNQTCVLNTGAGTDIGTLTGAKSATGKATLDLSGLIPAELCAASNYRWTGAYEVTNPLGLVSEA